MTLQQYIIDLSTRPTYELNNMKKALLSLGGFLNSDDDNTRLNACMIVLKMRKQQKGGK